MLIRKDIKTDKSWRGLLATAKEMLRTLSFNLVTDWRHAVLMSRRRWGFLSEEEAKSLEHRLVFARVVGLVILK